MASSGLEIAQHVQQSPGLALIALLVGGVILYTLGRIFYNLFLHPMRDVPGPWWWAASRIPFDYHSFNGTALHRILELHRQYGTEVRIAPNEVSLGDGAVWKEVWSAKPEFPKDPQFTEAKFEPVKNIFMADKDGHSRFRRLLAYAFSAQGIKDQEPRFMYYIDLLIQRLHEHASEGKTLDMVDWYTMTVFDVLGDLTWGEPFNGLRDQVVHNWVDVSMHATEFFFKAGALMKHYLPFLIPILADPKLAEAHKLNSLYSAQLTERRAEAGNNGPRGDFWDKVLIKSGENDKGEGMTLDEMKVNASFLILAGAETTATTLSGATYLLCKNPGVLQKVTQEVRTTFASSDEINLATVGQLTYMHHVLLEAMRMYPPVADGLPRVPPRGGAAVCGRWYPEGISIHANHFAINRLPGNFVRPDEFIPERWASDATDFSDDKKASFQPFAAGTRNCIGQNLAHAEMRLILSKILFDFDLELNEDKMGGRDWFATQKNFGVWFKDPVWVRMKAKAKAAA
ncbi:unnamed protein product [Cercospora beticola]|nr:unnamed protein product [Cercospora beticola]